MSKQVINNGAAIGPYSTAVIAGNHCYFSGLGGFVPGGTTVVEGGIEAEIRQTMENLVSTVGLAGYQVADLVSVTCYLRDLGDWPMLNEIYAQYFDDAPPARAAVAVADLPANSNVELSCVAWRAGAPAGVEG